MGKKKTSGSPEIGMDDERLRTEIRKTGFDLEYRISEILRGSGWSVINNKYYIDDQQEKVREIDIVAYRMTQVGELDIYTTLIISCKKSGAALWAFLAKKINTKDPNANWRPLTLWSNDKAFNFLQQQVTWQDAYFQRLKDRKIADLANIPATHIFAFREIRENKAPNDEAIFNSIVSLMKAQAYEIESLPQRKKTSSVYQFNLLSVVEADMREVFFDGEQRNVRRLDQAHHVAGYIINKKQTFARVHFIHSSVFQEALKEYDRLHVANCAIFSEDRNEFFPDAIKNYEKRSVFRDEWEKELRNDLLFVIRPEAWEELKSLLTWNEDEQRVEIVLNIGPEHIKTIKEDESAIEDIRGTLRKYYKYDGAFDLVDKYNPRSV